MSHDWARDAGIDLEALNLQAGSYLSRLDEIVTDRMETAVRESFATTVSFEPPTDILENLTHASRLVQVVREAQRVDAERLDDAVRRGSEAGEGVFVVQKEGRVLHAEPSPFVPANTIYLTDAGAWETVHERLFSDWENARFRHPNESIIDE